MAKILFIETPPIFSVTALVEKEMKLLFLKLSYQKGLGFPGGIVKGGETLEQALEREVMEETGLKVVESNYFTSSVGSYKGIPTASAVYTIETSGELKSSEEGELVWLKPEEAFGKMFYKDSDLTLKKYLASKKNL